MANVMRLIADSGSTKTDWVVLGCEGVKERVSTGGINPFQMGEDAIMSVLREELLPKLQSTAFVEVHFYGAGCRDDKAEAVRRCLLNMFPASAVTVQSDIMAAAHALCGRQRGIACILGTGANSCLFDGERIEKSISPLGYVLGDEGSGAALGKHLVSDALKLQMPESLRNEFVEEYGLSVGDVLESVYRCPSPNRYLASFAPFAKQHEEEAYVKALLSDEFGKFFTRNIAPYGEPSLPVHFVGSVAWHFAPHLREAGKAHGFKVGTILKSPLEGVVARFLIRE